MALPAGPIENAPDYRLEIESINDLDGLMKIYMEIGETSPYKGHIFINFVSIGDDRYIPVGTFTAGSPFPTIIDFENLVEVGSIPIRIALGQDGVDDNIIQRFLENAGIAVPPAPLEVYTELGTPNGQRHLTGQMFVKYEQSQYRKLSDYDFILANLEKPELYAGDLNNLFDANHVDARFIQDYQNRNS